MTGPTAEPLRLPSAVPDRAGLLERLVGVIRSEFRADELVFDATDSIFGGAACLVTDCARTARSRGLSQGHHLRWKAEGSPDVTVFAPSTDPGGVVSSRTPVAWWTAAATGWPQTGCASCTSSGGGVPGVPICMPG